ncbi:unnamed protein product [Fraxinus pennsylvanica]|uniref:Cation efflux protein transmembrane domain-containing protein n=1 Tax=Fraxinus pennsylvanica TaxID=56036 RepID=A0AAD2E7D7_9LAMI|nr:unnamed protein product [Fraxinus pennsylvanica]
MATLGFQVLVQALEQLIKVEPSGKMSSYQLVWLYVIMLTATGVKLVLWIYCRSSRNKIVRAYAKDHYFDVVTNVVGLIATVLGDKFYWWIDPSGAILLAFTISNWSGTVLENAVTLVGQSASPEVDIELPEDLPLKEAHAIGESLQIKIEELAEVERLLFITIMSVITNQNTIFSSNIKLQSEQREECKGRNNEQPVIKQVNNAGITGISVEGDVLVAKEIIEADEVSIPGDTKPQEAKITANGKIVQTYEWAKQCLQTNYYGTKRMVEAFIPLLRLSDTPRIVNVSSLMGILKFQSNEWAKQVLSNTEELTEDSVDNVLNKFLQDFKENSLKVNGWPKHLPAYRLSKSAINAYTRIMAKKYPNFYINCVCPGYVKTDINANTGPLTVEEGADSLLKLAMMPDGGAAPPSGLFFYRQNVSAF